MKEVEIIQLIRTRILRRGKGIDSDPIRIVTQYWTMDGVLEFEIDPFEKLVEERKAE